MLLVGAYERDNFGDLLFYHLTSDYMGRRNLAAGSIIAADMTRLIGTRVHAHNDLLSTKEWDVVWVVGGEVGGVDTEGALAMSLDDVEGQIFDKAGAEGRDAIAQFLSGAGSGKPAYIPILKDFPLNSGTPLILNSVGLGNMLTEGMSPGTDAAISAIRAASTVVVRDQASHDYTASIGVTSVLSPDMVHAISIRYPELAVSGEGHKPYFIFQSNGHIINQTGVEQIGEALAHVASITGWRPAFFLAGTARHHDRLDQYQGITRVLRRIAPGLVPAEITTRNPMELAAHIARSKLWIGSSLHGRIISGSYSRPRVSLENAKVATYAETWDPLFPVNVDFARLGDAALEAIESAGSPANVQASEDLAQRADAMTRGLVEEFL
ncbi:polysaccharide pyruvyl transferase WcaK-like protein [Cryobacterium sp. CAN_C3]|uniref:polysaccharide pyruvyl transferase family protein n=1 Tax=unclassified Cryobacterium TaxID=2649013 RepID=UPI0018C978A7|nr:polysaccharide pyruvyl transferase family protein [Cryobacterium sp. CAN_C3]MEC5155338.1 polysaccharide pyruvyl transferase WcaK-like protein [Cryobacterium sp. CAN_C3]